MEKDISFEIEAPRLHTAPQLLPREAACVDSEQDL